MRGKVRNGLVLILLCCGVSVVWAGEPPPARVLVGKVVQEEVAPTQSVTGVLYYERVSDVSTEVAGLVEEVSVNQGERVQKGDVLVRLNTDLLDKEISLTKARIAQVDLRIDNTEKNYKRLASLYERSGVSEKDFDDAHYAYQDARMEKQAMEETLGRLFLQQQRSVIKAPFAGVVLSKNVDRGAWVQQGKQLVSLAASADLFVRAPVAEELLRFILPGSEVALVINAFNKATTGTIVGIDPVADVKTKNVFVKIRIEPIDFIAENMSVRVDIPAGDKKTLAVFSRAGLIKFQGKDFIYTVKEDKASILPVNIVAYLGQKVAVDNPYMVAGMPVVVEGNERLRPDQPITVAGEK
jgi:membrane fusion protein (multidrug efflux system)